MSMNWKKHLLGYAAVAVACVMIGSALTLTQHPTAQAENTAPVVVTSPFTQAIAQVHDSVVGVSNYQQVRYSNRNTFDDFFGFGFPYGYGNGGREDSQPQTQEVLAGTGSGVVIGQGYVLTNYHVVDGASKLEITVSKTGAEEPDVYAAAVVAADENLDIAIVYAPDLPLAPVALGDSDTLQVGDWAICIGNPLGEQFAGTVTTGVVSALNRAVSSTNYDKYGRRETITNTMIQTDAAINSGNSGGGMFSVTGELMGIPTLKYSGSAFSGRSVEGIGMCIPINAAKPLIEDVLREKRTADVSASTTTAASSGNDLTGKPRLGISIASMNTSNAAVRSGQLPNGVYVSVVEENGPAASSGMQAGDIIVDVNGEVITSVAQLQTMIADKTEGDVLQVKVYRVPGLNDLTTLTEIPDGEYIDLEITLAIVDAVKQ